MEENKIWANLNDSYNVDVILVENKNLKDYIPKKDFCKVETKKNEIIEVNYNIFNIITEEYNNQNYIQILQKQNIVISYLLKLFRCSKIEDVLWEKFKPGLMWLLESSKFFTNKTLLACQQFKTDKIYRSSYKFCNKKYECDAVYFSILKKPFEKFYRCNGDHYVHYKLISDLTCLIEVLNNNQDNILNDLRVCLDTSNFVINHMYQELNNFNIYYSKQPNFDINKYYITALPKKH